jgi:hypothetical protein
MATIKDQLVAHFQQNPSPLVTGIALGSQPPAGAKLDNPDGAQPDKPYILILVEPVADCELQPVWNEVNSNAQGEPFLLLRTGRLVGLQASTGTSVSAYAPSRYNVPPAAAGTLGAILSAGGNQYTLSSNHVLAYNGRVPLGAAVVAPGTLDDPYGRNVVSRLSHFVALQPAAWPFNGTPDNIADCALAEVLSPNAIAHGPQVQVAAPVSTVTNVRKQGRTTSSTQAPVCMWSLTATPVDLSFGTYCFSGFMATLGSYQQGIWRADPFAAPGDSGALVLTDPGNQALGLVTARAYSSGVFSPNPPAAFPPPPQGAFVGYVVALCPLTSVRDELAPQLGVPPTQIQFFE